jgi:hypothetical protein
VIQRKRGAKSPAKTLWAVQPEKQELYQCASSMAAENLRCEADPYPEKQVWPRTGRITAGA